MKLKIWSLQRPETIFDPGVKEHRLAYSNFLKIKSWKDSKFRFILEDDHIDVVGSINSKLLNYYISKEFDQK